MRGQKRRLRASIVLVVALSTLLVAPSVATADEMTLSITINPIGTVNRSTGVATVSGTITCDWPTGAEGQYSDLEGRLTQITGRFQAVGYDWGEGCDEGTATWEVRFRSYTLMAFGAGRAYVEMDAYAWWGRDCYWDEEWEDYWCDDYFSEWASASAAVRLRPA
jgi:hypothetical protein